MIVIGYSYHLSLENDDTITSLSMSEKSMNVLRGHDDMMIINIHK